MKLTIKNFAQIKEAEIDFGKPGDLTLLVGQQASGKSLVLQWLKLMNDRSQIRSDWDRYGTNWRIQGNPLRELDTFLGEGLGQGFNVKKTKIKLNNKEFSFQARPSRSPAQESVYFIPAHRALLMAEGWPRPFSSFPPGTPYVARAQSERLVQWLGNGQETIFPISRKLPDQLRTQLDQAIFHGASVQADRQSPQSRLVLQVAGQAQTHIPYMAWTAGQREFVPLLMALYRLLPSSANTKDKEIKTVVIEEPELGLHPKAVYAMAQAILMLMLRGYRVAVSTHSPLMLDFAWTLRRLHAFTAAMPHHTEAWRVWNQSLALRKPVAKKIFEASTVRTYYMGYLPDGKSVMAKDISALRMDSNDPAEAAWGLMMEDSLRMSDIVSQMSLDFSTAGTPQ